MSSRLSVYLSEAALPPSDSISLTSSIIRNVY